MLYKATKRRRLCIRAQILKLCAGGAKLQTGLLLYANIHHKDWKSYYLPWLTERKLIEAVETERGLGYRTTARGKKWLADYAGLCP